MIAMTLRHVKYVLGKLCRQTRAVTSVEFAIVAPTFLTLLFAAFDFGHGVYAQAILQGVVQNAGRDAGLESGSTNLSNIDEIVLNQVQTVVPQGALLTSRRNYQSFSEVGKPEDFVDANGNGNYDVTECFTDLNGNVQWDSDRGVEGLGGADDVVLYSATLTYDHIFPIWKFIGGNERTAISASTTLRNQPFGDQEMREAVQVCP